MKPKFIIILNLLLGAALLGGVTLHPYTVSAETAEIETDSDDLEGVEYDNADQNGVLLDIDIVPDEYDRKHYDAALNTVYLEDTCTHEFYLCQNDIRHLRFQQYNRDGNISARVHDLRRNRGCWIFHYLLQVIVFSAYPFAGGSHNGTDHRYRLLLQPQVCSPDSRQAQKPV